ncbi:MAG TPA: hypothetical protein VIC29_16765 [Steroidobacteraceae bacterium]
MKSADRDWLARLTAQVWRETEGHGRFGGTFGDRVVLVPVPRSAPGLLEDWVGERVAWCLKELGLAVAVMPVLQRRHAVRKSAFAEAGERPSVLEHYASFAAQRAFWKRMPPARGSLACKPHGNELQLTLIDDVITRGRTMLAAAARLREAFPEAQIRAFALVRTLGPDETLRRIFDPCEGEVQWVSGDARRRP